MSDRLAAEANTRIAGIPLTPEQIVQRAGLGIHGKLWEWWPDLIVVISGFYVHPWTWDILKSRPHKTAIIFTESPYEDDRQINLVEKAEPDVVVLNDPKNIETFRQSHDKVIYLPHCYDPDIHHPGGARDTDFVFCGTGYPSRIEFLDRVDWSGVDAKLAGHWANLDGTSIGRFLIAPPDECMPNDQTADLYRRARVSANLYRGADPREANAPELQEGWAVGPREVELAACGTYFLREPRGEGDGLFPMLPTFTDPQEFGDLLRWALAHPDQREDAATQARAAIEDRVFVNNVRRLLQLVDAC